MPKTIKPPPPPLSAVSRGWANLSSLQVPDLDSPVEGGGGHHVLGGRTELDDRDLVTVGSNTASRLVHLNTVFIKIKKLLRSPEVPHFR